MSAAKKSSKPKAAKSGASGARSKSTKKTAKKTAAKKSTARKTAAKKTAKKTTAKKSTARKTAAKSTAKKSSARKKTTAKSARKTSARKTPAKKTPVMSRPAAPKRRVRPAKLDKASLAAIRERLENHRRELEAQLEEIERDSLTEAEDTGLHEDFADAGTSTFERERDLSIRNNVLDLLDQVKRAVARIDEGGYGTCENCGRPIDAARIKAFPRVLMCLDCKRRDERTR